LFCLSKNAIDFCIVAQILEEICIKVFRFALLYAIIILIENCAFAFLLAAMQRKNNKKEGISYG